MSPFSIYMHFIFHTKTVNAVATMLIIQGILEHNVGGDKASIHTEKSSAQQCGMDNKRVVHVTYARI